jgi:hypothetical protein
LRVKINSQNTPSSARQLSGKIASEIRLRDSTFLVSNGYH